MITVEGRLIVRSREPVERPDRWMEKFIVEEVRKLGRLRGFREMPHKVGSRKSPRSIDLLQTSIGGYFISNTYEIKLGLKLRISDLSHFHKIGFGLG